MPAGIITAKWYSDLNKAYIRLDFYAATAQKKANVSNREF